MMQRVRRSRTKRRVIGLRRFDCYGEIRIERDNIEGSKRYVFFLEVVVGDIVSSSMRMQPMSF
jgi:hypothetical protein